MTGAIINKAEPKGSTYGEVFLFQTRMCISTQIYSIKPLKIAAFAEFHKMLLNWKVLGGERSAVINLIEYVYEKKYHQNQPSEMGFEKPPGLTREYMAYRPKNRVQTNSFANLLRRNGLVFIGLWKSCWMRPLSQRLAFCYGFGRRIQDETAESEYESWSFFRSYASGKLQGNS